LRLSDPLRETADKLAARDDDGDLQEEVDGAAW
jgi:hypothetical protein